jgi:predicted nucleic acid-binding protein
VIVLDASVLIAHLDARDAHHAAAVDRLGAAARYGYAASVVTVAETLVGPARAGVSSTARRVLHELGIERIGLGPGAPERLAELRAGTGLKLPDCCVLLAAEDAAAEAILTFDERLGRAARDLGLAVQARPDGLDVRVPAAVGAAVRVRDGHAEARTLATDVADGSHVELLG